MNLTNPSLSNLSCEICFDPFDLEVRLPKSLPCCGKSVCRKCLLIISQERNHQCPWCKSKTNLNSESCKTNIQLLNLIEDDLKWEKCPHHQENMKLVCVQDKQKVCSYCGYTSECKNHELIHLMNLKQTSDWRLKELQGGFDLVENKMEKYDKIINENRNNFQDRICDSFDKQIYELQKAKAKTLMKFHSALNTKRNSMVDIFGENSSLRTELQAKIYNHMNFLKAKDPLGVIEEDLSTLKARVNNLIGGDQDVVYFEQQLSQMGPLLQQQLEKSFSEPKRDFDFFNNGFQGADGSLKIQLVGEIQIQVVGLSLEFSETAAGKKILACKQESDKGSKSIKLNFDQNKQVQGVSIDLRTLDLNETNLRSLEYSFAHIPKISQVILTAEPTPNAQKLEKISNLFSILFKKPQEIQDLSVSLVPTNDFAILLNVILPQLCSLEVLTIDAVAQELSLQNFENFTENLAVVAPKLKELKLNISGAYFPAAALKKLFISMPKIESFNLNVSKIASFDDEILSVLAENIQNFFPVIKKFVINLSQTKVSPECVSTLKEKIGHIQMTLILPEESSRQGMTLASLLRSHAGEVRISIAPTSSGPSFMHDLLMLGDTFSLLDRLRNRGGGNGGNPPPRPQRDDNNFDMFFE